MKPNPILTAALLAGLICSAAADTLHLKNGTTYEGKILSETTESYVVEVMVTRSIKEEKTIAKAEVAKIEREKLDEKAFIEIAAMSPTPDLLEPGEYQIRLQTCYKFVKAYPSSPLAEKARAITGELEKELDLISQGGVKLGGKVISAAERQSNKVEISARALEVSIRNHAKRGEWVPALRDFTKLEADYSTTAPFKDVLPTVKQVISQYHSQLVESAAGLDKRLADRKIGLERMASQDRNASERAIAEQNAAVEKQFADEKKAGVKWTTPDLFNKSTLDEATRFSDQELKRLEALRIDPKLDAGKAWRDAWSAVHGTDPKAVTPALADARSAKVPTALVTELEDLAKKAGLMK